MKGLPVRTLPFLCSLLVINTSFASGTDILYPQPDINNIINGQPRVSLIPESGFITPFAPLPSIRDTNSATTEEIEVEPGVNIPPRPKQKEYENDASSSTDTSGLEVHSQEDSLREQALFEYWYIHNRSKYTRAKAKIEFDKLPPKQKQELIRSFSAYAVAEMEYFLYGPAVSARDQVAPEKYNAEQRNIPFPVLRQLAILIKEKTREEIHKRAKVKAREMLSAILNPRRLGKSQQDPVDSTGYSSGRGKAKSTAFPLEKPQARVTYNTPPTGNHLYSSKLLPPPRASGFNQWLRQLGLSIIPTLADDQHSLFHAMAIQLPNPHINYMHSAESGPYLRSLMQLMLGEEFGRNPGSIFSPFRLLELNARIVEKPSYGDRFYNFLELKDANSATLPPSECTGGLEHIVMSARILGFYALALSYQAGFVQEAQLVLPSGNVVNLETDIETIGQLLKYVSSRYRTLEYRRYSWAALTGLSFADDVPPEAPFILIRMDRSTSDCSWTALKMQNETDDLARTYRPEDVWAHLHPKKEIEKEETREKAKEEIAGASDSKSKTSAEDPASSKPHDKSRKKKRSKNKKNERNDKSKIKDEGFTVDDSSFLTWSKETSLPVTKQESEVTSAPLTETEKVDHRLPPPQKKDGNKKRKRERSVKVSVDPQIPTLPSVELVRNNPTPELPELSESSSDQTASSVAKTSPDPDDPDPAGNHAGIEEALPKITPETESPPIEKEKKKKAKKAKPVNINPNLNKWKNTLIPAVPEASNQETLAQSIDGPLVELLKKDALPKPTKTPKASITSEWNAGSLPVAKGLKLLKARLYQDDSGKATTIDLSGIDQLTPKIYSEAFELFRSAAVNHDYPYGWCLLSLLNKNDPMKLPELPVSLAAGLHGAIHGNRQAGTVASLRMQYQAPDQKPHHQLAKLITTHQASHPIPGELTFRLPPEHELTQLETQAREDPVISEEKPQTNSKKKKSGKKRDDPDPAQAFDSALAYLLSDPVLSKPETDWPFLIEPLETANDASNEWLQLLYTLHWQNALFRHDICTRDRWLNKVRRPHGDNPSLWHGHLAHWILAFYQNIQIILEAPEIALLPVPVPKSDQISEQLNQVDSMIVSALKIKSDHQGWMTPEAAHCKGKTPEFCSLITALHLLGATPTSNTAIELRRLHSLSESDAVMAADHLNRAKNAGLPYASLLEALITIQVGDCACGECLPVPFSQAFGHLFRLLLDESLYGTEEAVVWLVPFFLNKLNPMGLDSTGALTTLIKLQSRRPDKFLLRFQPDQREIQKLAAPLPELFSPGDLTLMVENLLTNMLSQPEPNLVTAATASFNQMSEKFKPDELVVAKQLLRQLGSNEFPWDDNQVESHPCLYVMNTSRKAAPDKGRINQSFAQAQKQCASNNPVASEYIATLRKIFNETENCELLVQNLLNTANHSTWSMVIPFLDPLFTHISFTSAATSAYLPLQYWQGQTVLLNFLQYLYTTAPDQKDMEKHLNLFRDNMSECVSEQQVKDEIESKQQYLMGRYRAAAELISDASKNAAFSTTGEKPDEAMPSDSGTPEKDNGIKHDILININQPPISYTKLLPDDYIQWGSWLTQGDHYFLDRLSTLEDLSAQQLEHRAIAYLSSNRRSEAGFVYTLLGLKHLQIDASKNQMRSTPRKTNCHEAFLSLEKGIYHGFPYAGYLQAFAILQCKPFNYFYSVDSSPSQINITGNPNHIFPDLFPALFFSAVSGVSAAREILVKLMTAHSFMPARVPQLVLLSELLKFQAVQGSPYHLKIEFGEQQNHNFIALHFLMDNHMDALCLLSQWIEEQIGEISGGFNLEALALYLGEKIQQGDVREQKLIFATLVLNALLTNNPSWVCQEFWTEASSHAAFLPIIKHFFNDVRFVPLEKLPTQVQEIIHLCIADYIKFIDSIVANPTPENILKILREGSSTFPPASIPVMDVLAINPGLVSDALEQMGGSIDKDIVLWQGILLALYASNANEKEQTQPDYLQMLNDLLLSFPPIHQQIRPYLDAMGFQQTLSTPGSIVPMESQTPTAPETINTLQVRLKNPRDNYDEALKWAMDLEYDTSTFIELAKKLEEEGKTLSPDFDRELAGMVHTVAAIKLLEPRKVEGAYWLDALSVSKVKETDIDQTLSLLFKAENVFHSPYAGLLIALLQTKNLIHHLEMATHGVTNATSAGIASEMLEHLMYSAVVGAEQAAALAIVFYHYYFIPGMASDAPAQLIRLYDAFNSRYQLRFYTDALITTSAVAGNSPDSHSPLLRQMDTGWLNKLIRLLEPINSEQPLQARRQIIYELAAGDTSSFSQYLLLLLAINYQDQSICNSYQQPPLLIEELLLPSLMTPPDRANLYQSQRSTTALTKLVRNLYRGSDISNRITDQLRTQFENILKPPYGHSAFLFASQAPFATRPQWLQKVRAQVEPLTISYDLSAWNGLFLMINLIAQYQLTSTEDKDLLDALGKIYSSLELYPTHIMLPNWYRAMKPLLRKIPPGLNRLLGQP